MKAHTCSMTFLGFNNLAWRNNIECLLIIAAVFAYYGGALADDNASEAINKNSQNTLADYFDAGFNLYSQGDNDGALTNYLKALEIGLETLGKNHPDVASIYTSIGMALSAKGDYDGTITNYNKALGIYEQIPGDYQLEKATIYLGIGTAALSIKSDYDEALLYFNKELEIYKQVSGESYSDMATVYIMLGVTFLRKADYDEAIANYNETLEICREASDENSYEAMVAYASISTCYNLRGEPSIGLPYIIKAFKISYKTLGANNPETIDYRNRIYNFGGDPDAIEAEAIAEKIAEIEAESGK